MVTRCYLRETPLNTPNGVVTVGAGDFSLRLYSEEVAKLKTKALRSTFNDLRGSAVGERFERGDLVLFFQAGTPRWGDLAKATGVCGYDISLKQFLVIALIILTPTFELSGEEAYKAIRQLYSLTPGARKRGAGGFPEPKDTQQLSQIKLVKHVDQNFRNNVTVKLVLPSGEMAGRINGGGGRNIKALGKIFTATVGIHFWVETFAEQADPVEAREAILAAL